jgi:ribonuclease BN (tRNA processing enzyme)
MYMFDFGGFKLGYSPDAAFDQANLDWLDQADMILHDCWFGEVKVLGGDIRNIHTPIEDLLTMPESFQQKTFLVHYADTAYDDDPSKPNHDIGAYRLLEQGKQYRLK